MTFYALTIEAEDSLFICSTLDEARDQALEYIESQGWVHEQQYSVAPIGGLSWGCPGVLEKVVITPIVAESEDDAYAIAIMTFGPRYLQS
jgi:hypothetical protein